MSSGRQRYGGGLAWDVPLEKMRDFDEVRLLRAHAADSTLLNSVLYI
jgi:hypothetical protein